MDPRNFSHLPLRLDSPPISLLIHPNLSNLLAVFRPALLLSKMWRADCLLLRPSQSCLIPRVQKTKHVLFSCQPPWFLGSLSVHQQNFQDASQWGGGEGKAHTIARKKEHPPQESKHIIRLGSHLPPGLNDRLIFY